MWVRALDTRMTALAAGIRVDLTGVPAYAPDELQLADLELLLGGAFEPLNGFMCDADAVAVARDGRLADGRPFPFAVTLDVPANAVPPDAGMLVLEDPEGAPLALLQITERSQAGQGGAARISGPVRALAEPEHGPFRRLRRDPAETRAALGTARQAPPGEVPQGDGPQSEGPQSEGPQNHVPQNHVPQSEGPQSEGPQSEGPQNHLPQSGGPQNHLPYCGVPPGGERQPASRTPAPDKPVLACLTRGPLHRRELGQLRHLADTMRARLLLMPLVVGPAEVVVRPEALVRSMLAALPQLPADTLVVPVPLAPRGPEGSRDEVLARALVAAAYGATHLFAPAPVTRGQAAQVAARAAAGSPYVDSTCVGRTSVGSTSVGSTSVGSTFVGSMEIGNTGATIASVPRAPIPVVMPGEWAFDVVAEVWRPAVRISPQARRDGLSPAELTGLLERGDEIPDWFTPAPVARELHAARPPRHERGLVLFFTGLSGAGKSTVARDVADALAERGDRTVSLLDGDHVRRLLSAGLGFSRADRDLNIVRIGFVAAEIARHGGVAICAPIAPYAAARARVRAMVSETGDFLLVHIATSLEACEARDRKGLYAKARAGAISGFTGISDPYEEPDDADLVIDTAVVTRQDAANAVLGVLGSGGWLAQQQRGRR